MGTKQFIAIVSAVAVAAAAMGVVISSQFTTREVKLSLDLGEGRSLDVSKLAAGLGDMEEARIRANESAAIATLRSIASAQAQLQSSAAIDVDGDGGGEYGFLGEMAGAAILRGRTEPLYPAVLSSSFGDVSRDGIVTRSGYCFRVFLPGLSSDGRADGVHQGSATSPSTDNAEILWAAYAWPTSCGKTGARAFFMNQEGDLRETDNADRRYDGEGHAPAFDAAFSASAPGDMSAVIATGEIGCDGLLWRSAGR